MIEMNLEIEGETREMCETCFVVQRQGRCVALRFGQIGQTNKTEKGASQAKTKPFGGFKRSANFASSLGIMISSSFFAPLSS